jgi:hypothetical protein
MSRGGLLSRRDDRADAVAGVGRAIPTAAYDCRSDRKTRAVESVRANFFHPCTRKLRDLAAEPSIPAKNFPRAFRGLGVGFLMMRPLGAKSGCR